MAASSNDTQHITLSWTGLTHKELLNLSSMSHQMSTDMIAKIFSMPIENVGEIYRQAGIRKPYLEPISMEAFYYALLWLHLCGKCNYALNAYGKIEYFIKESDDRIGINYELFTRQLVSNRIASLMGISKKNLWLIKYMADKLINGMPDERRAILSDLMVYGKRILIRQDYKQFEPFLDIDKIIYQRRKLYFSKLQFYCLMDRVRLEACHTYRGNKEDISYAIKGSATRRLTVMGKLEMPLMNIDANSRAAKAFIKCLRLEKGKSSPEVEDE